MRPADRDLPVASKEQPTACNPLFISHMLERIDCMAKWRLAKFKSWFERSRLQPICCSAYVYPINCISYAGPHVSLPDVARHTLFQIHWTDLGCISPVLRGFTVSGVLDGILSVCGREEAGTCPFRFAEEPSCLCDLCRRLFPRAC